MNFASDAYDINEVTKTSGPRYFVNWHWGQCLEMLEHLCQYSEHTILISADAGMGKTTLQQAFVSRVTDIKVFCAKGQDLEVGDLNDLIAEGFQRHIKQAGLASSRYVDWVMLLDEAHNLSLDRIVELLRLVHNKKSNHARLRLILLAEPALEQQLRATIPEFVRQHIQSINIEALTLNETQSFLNYLWQQSGNHTDLPFRMDKIKKIHQITAGNPRGVQNMARAILTGNQLPEVNSKRKVSVWFSPVLLGLTVFFGLLFALVSYLWPQNKVAIKQAIETDHVVQAVVSEHKDNNVKTLEKVIHELQVELKQVKHELFALQQLLNDANPVAPVITHEVSQVLSEQQVKVAPEDIEEKSTNIELETDQQEIANAILNDTMVDDDLHNKTGYALQLVAYKTEQEVLDFIEKYSLTNTQCYKTLRNGQPWYVAIHGEYSSYNEALAASQQLSKQLRALQPWPRKFSELAKVIDNAQ